MPSLRTPEAEQKYVDFRKRPGFGKTCALCTEPAIKQYKYWKIVKNNFPYDRIAAIHDMILPIEHKVEKDLTQEEWIEFQQIKKEHIDSTYEFIIEATKLKRSIPEHLHLHLIVTK